MLITVIVKLPNDQLVDVTLTTDGVNDDVNVRATHAVGRGPWVPASCTATIEEA